MKKGIHPEYVPCKVTCVTSGKQIQVFATLSIQEVIKLQILQDALKNSDKNII